MSTATQDRLTVNLEDAQDLEQAPHLLIVERESTVGSPLKAYMERQGFEVTCLNSGGALSAYLEDRIADLILLDHNLSDGDGLSICLEIKENKQLGYIPIIMMMENPERRETLAARISGADDYLQKPVNERDMLLRVLALLRTKRQIDRLIRENLILSQGISAHNRTIQEMLTEQAVMRERTNQAELLKQHIIRNVNHELRTPMLQIKSAVSTLVEIMQEVSADEKTQRISNYATQAVGRMEELIQNISQLQMMDDIKIAPLSLHDAVTQAMHMLRRSWSHQRNTARVHYHEPDEKPLVNGDRRAIPRIIFLLVDNALKFSPEKSDVIIEVKANAKTVSVRIKDRGIGIPEAHLSRIFEPFFQVEPGTTRRFGGVGVGLSSAQTLAHAMGTEITVKSTSGKGSVFSFVLARAHLSGANTAP